MQNKNWIILILGGLTALSPFSIDMYLPAFPEMAREFGVPQAQISLSLSGYFLGLALGQLLYGPLLDRFGRKPPLRIGLVLYIIASLGCLRAHSGGALVAWRVVQALGGCAAGVASMAMVRDLFETHESARVFALLMLILGVSPLLAPTTGGYLTASLGWRAVFILLAVIASLLLLVVHYYLPESHPPDPGVRLHVAPIARTFWTIAREPRFYTYVVSGALAFSGLFVYLSGSTIIFMSHFGVDQKVYGWIFATIAAGLIGASQCNTLLLRRFSSAQILTTGMIVQVVIALTFCLATAQGWLGLPGTVMMLFAILACLGLTNPNSTALALAPFAKTAGQAAALMGFVQMGLGTIGSMMVGLLGIQEILPVVQIMAATAVAALLVLTFGRRQIARAPISEIN